MNADLRVGVITRTHGVRGEMKVYPTTDSPLRFQELERVLLKCGGRMRCFPIESARFFKNMVILKLRGIDSLEEAEKYRGGELFIGKEDGEPLAENEYYIGDIIGLSAEDEGGNVLGVVKDVLQTGANDVYVVAREGQRDLLLPAIRDCILKVDLENSRMTVHVMDGLLDL